MIHQLLSITAASIPISLVVWFVIAIANRIFTRCKPIRPKLAQVERAITTSAPKPSNLLAEPKFTLSASPIGTHYQSLSLAELRKLARRRGVEPKGDARRRESWLDALTSNS